MESTHNFESGPVRLLSVGRENGDRTDEDREETFATKNDSTKKNVMWEQKFKEIRSSFTDKLSEDEECIENGKDGMSEYFSPNSQSPLCNYVVLQCIFDLLAVDDLKMCRQVCKLWDDMSTPYLLSKAVISVNTESSVRLSILKNWMNSSFWFRSSNSRDNKACYFVNFVCDKITHSSYPNIWEILGSHVKYFSISHWYNDDRDLTIEDYEDLLRNRCPNMEELTIPTTEKLASINSFLENSDDDQQLVLNLKTLKITGDAQPDEKFWHIIELSPKLQHLRIECKISEEFWNPMAVREGFDERLRQLDNVEVRSYGNESISQHSSGTYFLGRKWSLKILSYECYVLSDALMHECSVHVSDTCEHFYIALFNRAYEPWPADKGKLWLLPPSLKKLKTFKMEIDDHCEGPIFCRALVLSVFLPCLHSVELGIYDDEDWNANDWEDGLFARIFGDCTEDMNIRREQFRRLKLPSKFQDVSCVTALATIYPNMRELEMSSPKAQALSAIFKYWKNLERLKVTLQEDANVDWSRVLTGLPPSGDSMMQVRIEDESLANLKNLTSIEIKLMSVFGSGEEVVMPLNDSVVEHAFLKLPNLQRISIEGQMFSKEVVSRLRNNSLPFCYISLR